MRLKPLSSASRSAGPIGRIWIRAPSLSSTTERTPRTLPRRAGEVRRPKPVWRAAAEPGARHTGARDVCQGVLVSVNVAEAPFSPLASML